MYRYFFTALAVFAISSAGTAAAIPAEPEKTPAQQVAELHKMCSDSGEEIQTRQAEKALFNRLGGADKIETFAKNIFDEHKKNDKISSLFTTTIEQIFVKNVADFLNEGTGGPKKYTGRNMKDVHNHMKINNSDFLEAGKDIETVMKRMGYGENEIQEIFCALASLAGDVIVG